MGCGQEDGDAEARVTGKCLTWKQVVSEPGFESRGRFGRGWEIYVSIS